MGKQPSISVVIDTFNYGRYIEKAITSALEQEFPRQEREIIVVDDGSVDDTAKKLSKYRDEVTYIYKQNGGQASALNTGIEKARGHIIAFLDADDYWYPQKLTRVAEAYELSERVDFVYHNLSVADANSTVTGTWLSYNPDILVRPEHRKVDLDAYLSGILKEFIFPFPPTSGITARRDCLLKIMPIPPSYCVCADTYLHYFLPFHTRECVLIREPLGCWMVHESNNLHTQSTQTLNLSLLIDTYEKLLTQVMSYTQAHRMDASGLQEEIEWMLIGWQNQLHGQSTPFKKIAHLIRGHRKIIKHEGLRKYLCSSYNYRKDQIRRIFTNR